MVLKVVGSILGWAIQEQENCLSQASSKWVHFSKHVRLRLRKERDELPLSYVVPKIQWASDLHCSYDQ